MVFNVYFWSESRSKVNSKALSPYYIFSKAMQQNWIKLNIQSTSFKEIPQSLKGPNLVGLVYAQ